MDILNKKPIHIKILSSNPFNFQSSSQIHHLHFPQDSPLMSCKLPLCVAVEGPTQHLTCQGWSNGMDFYLNKIKKKILKGHMFFSQNYANQEKGNINSKSQSMFTQINIIIIYTPEVKHGTWKWWFSKGISFSRVWFLGSMLNFRGVCCCE